MAHKVRTITWIVLAAASVGCASEVADQPVEARVTTIGAKPSIFGGAKDDDVDGDAAPGVVALKVGVGATFELCSGTLIAPNVVLTARHCVTKNITTSVACDENGQSANGQHVASDEDPASIGIYLGMSPSFAKPPVAVARAVVAPTGSYLCDSDIALIVLEKPITDIAPVAVRIHGAARQGEMIRSVGYGQNDKSSPIGTRFHKAGVAVLAQGKEISASKTPLGTHEFEVGKSICQGDSGGPALSEQTGAVIGVVSRGGGCDDDFGHIYTTTAGFESLFADAFKLAGATPILEKGDGDATSASTRSNTTATNGPAPEEAKANEGGCAVSAPTSLSRQASTGTMGLVVIAAAVAAVARRRRRAR